MGSLSSFVGGIVVGGIATFVGLKYHVVRATDGYHLVPKLQAQFDEAYVDIREFDFEDWNKHRALAVAMVQADKGYLMQEAATDSLRQTVDNVLEGLGNFRRSGGGVGTGQEVNPWNTAPTGWGRAGKS